MKQKPPPRGLVDTRPAAADNPELQNPVQGPNIGPQPKRYTRGVHDQICENIRKGNRPVTAAGMAGIPSATFYAWMKRGKEGDPHLWEFAQDVELAFAEAEGKAVAAIAGDNGSFEIDPENAKWHLERLHADGFSKDAATKVNAMLADFFERLERALPPEIFKMVIAAAAGNSLAASRPTFQLSNGNSEEDDEEDSESS